MPNFKVNSIIDLPSISNPLLVSTASLLSDLDDHETVQSYFAPNRLVVFRFATATSNQPVTAVYGFMLVYFGANRDVYIEYYFNRDGIIRSRYKQNNSVSAWKAIT